MSSMKPSVELQHTLSSLVFIWHTFLYSSLFWTENDSSNQGHIFHKHFNSNTISDLLGGERRSRRSTDNCTCQDGLSVSPVVAMDYSSSGRTEIVFIDMPTYSIMATDVSGCQCRVVFRAAASDTKGRFEQIQSILFICEKLSVHFILCCLTLMQAHSGFGVVG